MRSTTTSLRTRQHTWVRKPGIEVQLEPGQPVQVGISRKYEPGSIAEPARRADLRLARQSLDHRGWFSLNEFVPASGGAAGT